MFIFEALAPNVLEQTRGRNVILGEWTKTPIVVWKVFLEQGELK
jgi:hypothetical protein